MKIYIKALTSSDFREEFERLKAEVVLPEAPCSTINSVISECNDAVYYAKLIQSSDDINQAKDAASSIESHLWDVHDNMEKIRTTYEHMSEVSKKWYLFTKWIIESL